jgi:hypothetical protein
LIRPLADTAMESVSGIKQDILYSTFACSLCGISDGSMGVWRAGIRNPYETVPCLLVSSAYFRFGGGSGSADPSARASEAP